MTNLRVLREGRGLGVRAVAKGSGVSAATVSRVERGGEPDVKTLIKLARYYQLDKLADQIEWLVS